MSIHPLHTPAQSTQSIASGASQHGLSGCVCLVWKVLRSEDREGQCREDECSELNPKYSLVFSPGRSTAVIVVGSSITLSASPVDELKGNFTPSV